MSQGHKEGEIGWLLAQLRRQVTRLHQLERASGDEGDLTTSRQTIAELQRRIARLAGTTPTTTVAPRPPDRKETMTFPSYTLESNGGGT